MAEIFGAFIPGRKKLEAVFFPKNPRRPAAARLQIIRDQTLI
jgi:hypothetical protein